MISINTPKVSVIVAAYNASSYVQRAVASVQDQTMDDWELIVIDDCSLDNTIDIVEQLIEDDPRIRLQKLANNGGPSRARNEGLAMACGRWVAILDADDAWKKGRLADLVGFAEQNQLDVILDNYIRYDDETQTEIGPIMNREPLYREIQAIDLLQSEFPFRAVRYGLLKPIIRKEFLDQHRIAYINEIRYAEDFLLLATILLEGGRAALIGTPYYIYTLSHSLRSGVKSQGTRTLPNEGHRVATARWLLDRYSNRVPNDVGDALVRYYRTIRSMTEGQQMHALLRSGRYLHAVAAICRKPHAALIYAWTLPKAKILRARLGLQ